MESQSVANLSEQSAYMEMWKRPEYRAVAPGEHVAQVFLRQAKPPIGAKVIDLGCGTGRGALALAMPPPMGAHMVVTMVDFAENCLDDDIRQMLTTQQQSLKFVQADLTKKIPVTAQYGFCTDVMEHIPPQDVDRVLDNCLMAAEHVFFQISTVDDCCGKLIGRPLHLSVHPYEWWLKKFNERECVIHWSKEEADCCMFYVSAWVSGKDITDSGVLNITEDKARENVRFNVAQGWKQVEPHETNSLELMLVGGGPSLKQFEEEIIARRKDGMLMATFNGTYNWALERGLTPSCQIMVDAREFNKRFTKPVVDKCLYLIASQCDPAVLEGLPKDRTWLWHTSSEMIKDILNAQYERWYGIPGGTTVMLRAFFLLRMLGYKRFHLYGCDSCISGGEHHAYAQTENDGQLVVPAVLSDGSIWQCHPWMISQANEFMDMIKFFGDEIEMIIYGDGLLAHMLKTGAALADAEPMAMS